MKHCKIQWKYAYVNYDGVRVMNDIPFKINQDKISSLFKKENTESNKIIDELIRIYYKYSIYYEGSDFELTQEEINYINQKILIRPLFQHGYSIDVEKQKKFLENKWYELSSMQVSRSSSKIYIKGFGIESFNSVGFEYKIEN